MIRTTSGRSTLPLLLGASALVAAGCTLGIDGGDLDSRCEVHLEELSRPVVDLVELTGRARPAEACDLYLADRDGADSEWRFQRVEPSRWSVACGEDAPEGEGCSVDVDPLLRLAAVDGLLLCEPAAGRGCGERAPGERTQCRVAEELELGRDVASLSARSLVSVDTFEGVDDLAAITWVDGVFGDVRVVTSFLRREEGSWVLEREVDVCAECAMADDGVPADEYVAYQVATRGDRVLLAGPCGSSGLVEVAPDGSCEVHDVALEGDPTSPAVPLGVVETGLEDAPYATVWTDGLAVYTSSLGADLQVRGPAREHYREDRTQSREEPAAICVDLERDGSSDGCLLMWSEVDRYADGTRASGPEAGESRLQYRVLGPGDLSGWETGRWTLDAGRGSRFAVDPAPPADREGSATALVVSSHPLYGLVARRLWLARPTAAAGLDVTFASSAAQVAAGSAAYSADVVPLLAGVAAVAWTEAGPSGEGGATLHAGLLSAEGEEGGLALEALALPGLEGTVPYQRPVAASRATVDGETELLVAYRESEESCDHGVVIARGRRAAEGAPSPVEWGEVETYDLSSTGSCGDCSGAAAWAGGCFLVALPSESGVSLTAFCEGEPPRTLPGVPGPDEPTCSVALTSNEPADLVFLAVERGEGAGLLVFEGRPSAEGWSFVAAASEGTPEDARRDELGRSPVFSASTGGGAPLLLWSETPFPRWPQRNLRAARLLGVTGSRALATTDPIARDIADSRVGVAAVALSPCTDDGGGEPGRTCAFLAMSRPDPAEVVDGQLYDQAIVLTPTVASRVIDLSGPADECASCGPVELVDEEVWRGIPTSLASPVDPGSRFPVGAFAQVAPTVWDRGTVSTFGLDFGGLSLSGTGVWEADPLEALWLLGDDPLRSEARSLRLAPVEGGLAALWVVTVDGEGPLAPDEDRLLFAFVDDGLEPTTRALALDSWPSEAARDPHGDVRWLMAQHLQASLTAVSDGELLAAWVVRPAAATGEPPALRARSIACRAEPFGQDP